jgi:signal transduction histidine kinase
MLDRARVFNSSDLQDEKMVSLGKLSAGLAHELNNPASAIERSAVLLEDRLEDSERAARALGVARLTDSQLAVVDRVRESCAATSERGVRSPIEQAEREEAMADWLADHGLDTAMAEALADTAATIEGLDRPVGAPECRGGISHHDGIRGEQGLISERRKRNSPFRSVSAKHSQGTILRLNKRSEKSERQTVRIS